MWTTVAGKPWPSPGGRTEGQLVRPDTTVALLSTSSPSKGISTEPKRGRAHAEARHRVGRFRGASRSISGETTGPLPPLDAAVAAHIAHALALTRGRIEGSSGAARWLAINPHTLRARMRKPGKRCGSFLSQRNESCQRPPTLHAVVPRAVRDGCPFVEHVCAIVSGPPPPGRLSRRAGHCRLDANRDTAGFEYLLERRQCASGVVRGRCDHQSPDPCPARERQRSQGFTIGAGTNDWQDAHSVFVDAQKAETIGAVITIVTIEDRRRLRERQQHDCIGIRCCHPCSQRQSFPFVAGQRDHCVGGTPAASTPPVRYPQVARRPKPGAAHTPPGAQMLSTTASVATDFSQRAVANTKPDRARRSTEQR